MRKRPREHSEASSEDEDRATSSAASEGGDETEEEFEEEEESSGASTSRSNSAANGEAASDSDQGQSEDGESGPEIAWFNMVGYPELLEEAMKAQGMSLEPWRKVTALDEFDIPDTSSSSSSDSDEEGDSSDRPPTPPRGKTSRPKPKPKPKAKKKPAPRRSDSADSATRVEVDLTGLGSQDPISTQYVQQVSSRKLVGGPLRVPSSISGVADDSHTDFNPAKVTVIVCLNDGPTRRNSVVELTMESVDTVATLEMQCRLWAGMRRRRLVFFTLYPSNAVGLLPLSIVYRILQPEDTIVDIGLDASGDRVVFCNDYAPMIPFTVHGVDVENSAAASTSAPPPAVGLLPLSHHGTPARSKPVAALNDDLAAMLQSPMPRMPQGTAETKIVSNIFADMMVVYVVMGIDTGSPVLCTGPIVMPATDRPGAAIGAYFELPPSQREYLSKQPFAPVRIVHPDGSADPFVALYDPAEPSSEADVEHAPNGVAVVLPMIETDDDVVYFPYTVDRANNPDFNHDLWTHGEFCVVSNMDFGDGILMFDVQSVDRGVVYERVSALEMQLF